MENTDCISKRDAVFLLELIHECVTCKNKTGIKNIVDSLSSLVAIDNAVFGIAQIGTNGLIQTYDVMNISYPEEWLITYKRKNFCQVDPIAKENFSNFELQFWEDTYKKWNPPKEFISAARDFNLYNGIACGVRNLKSTEGSLFSVAGKLENHPREKFIIENLTPHLHTAFTTYLSKTKAPVNFELSKREIEVLNWVKKGKSSWDISVILAISVRTVKFHVENIMVKLNAVSRTHAVAIALSAGVIDID
ncbi:sensor helix-turn-helix transcriptional regulator, LuxR family, autoind_bind domain-containing [Geotalea daltonii FRC-32]|uniref:Sensor helix-turn-helix transcriptional regulator, LuxR family, autoind_bind domain-containing n=1 Tax=Geotalea daltonii (strain DSM 22248 / JCM 15807 / FRC-32) TaxID=316067 RepID=B9LZZ1_GEODF|nr:LuxR family transcriptional regulator [Geotalea daltonii]ACM20771.1 sensor helix-turn-helix transcriptional regulator, LuxR family, autoind_bind domain-containing [Geotalea daltonii FRC-32]